MTSAGMPLAQEVFAERDALAESHREVPKR
jgi:hypothetical protein